MHQTQGEQIKLEGRELALYQAGQAAGMAHAYREFAKQLGAQKAMLESEADKAELQARQHLGNAFSGKLKGARAGRRLVNAMRALTTG